MPGRTKVEHGQDKERRKKLERRSLNKCRKWHIFCLQNEDGWRLMVCRYSAGAFQETVLLYLSWLPQRSETQAHTDVFHMAGGSICFQKKKNSIFTLKKQIIYIHIAITRLLCFLMLICTFYMTLIVVLCFPWFLWTNLFSQLKTIPDIYTSWIHNMQCCVYKSHQRGSLTDSKMITLLKWAIS